LKPNFTVSNNSGYDSKCSSESMVL